MINNYRRSSLQDRLVTDIVLTVAEEVGCDPLEMNPPLGEVIDADALQQLLNSSTDNVQVTFSYQGKEIVVRSGGEVTTRDPALGD